MISSGVLYIDIFVIIYFLNIVLLIIFRFYSLFITVVTCRGLICNIRVQSSVTKRETFYVQDRTFRVAVEVDYH